MDNKYYYKLVRYFQEFQNEILQSIIQRGMMDKNSANKVIENILSNIKLVKDYSIDINEINVHKKNNSDLYDKEKLSNIKNQSRKLKEAIIESILCLPNTLDSKCIMEDNVISIHLSKNFEKHENITFLEYIDKYTIKSSGRVIFMNNSLAKLFYKLKNFLILHNYENKFQLLQGSEIVNKSFLQAAGQLPAFKDTLFQVTEDEYCIPTGEVVILEYILKDFERIKEEINKNELGVCYSTFSACYRNENSNHSALNKPLIRQNVFHKVETFIVCKLSQEMQALELLLKNVKKILTKLDMQYRIIKVGSLEMSKSAYIQYDFEVFLPISQKYVEIASCSTCNVYQLSRDEINCSNYEFDHCTLNCSALPLERLMAACIEYYWDDNQKVFKLPELDSNQQPFG